MQMDHACPATSNHLHWESSSCCVKFDLHLSIYLHLPLVRKEKREKRSMAGDAARCLAGMWRARQCLRASNGPCLGVRFGVHLLHLLHLVGMTGIFGGW